MDLKIFGSVILVLLLYVVVDYFYLMKLFTFLMGYSANHWIVFSIFESSCSTYICSHWYCTIAFRGYSYMPEMCMQTVWVLPTNNNFMEFLNVWSLSRGIVFIFTLHFCSKVHSKPSFSCKIYMHFLCNILYIWHIGVKICVKVLHIFMLPALKIRRGHIVIESFVRLFVCLSVIPSRLQTKRKI